MSGSDAILVGEGWISEYYFTTDATSNSFQAKVLERRKTWDAEEKEGHSTPRRRFVERRGELTELLARIGADLEGDEADDERALRGTGPTQQELAPQVHELLLDVIGLDRHGLRVERDGPVVRVSTSDLSERAPLVVVLAEPVAAIEDLLAKHGKTLADDVELAGGETVVRSAARLLSALFVAETGPSFALVLAGRWALLAERERWAEGRYLAVDVQSVAERNDVKRGGETDRMLTCLAAESIAPDTDGGLWWPTVLEESVKHTMGVSQDLRDGVRASIEIIANEVVARRAARGWDPLPPDQAQPLAIQSLRFLYRILFLLYAEASPQLGVLPVGAPEYEQGYSLDRLRDLVQVPLSTPQALQGTHLYDSLGTLFRLINAEDFTPHERRGDDDASAAGLEFHPLRADLFLPVKTAHIDEVGLGNAALQKVLTHLLLSKEKRGRDRGFISYAELGINQLGAVYEGLMSYTGFFATEDLYEVAKGGDASKGSWVVPTDRIDGIKSSDFVKEVGPDGGERPVLHPRGSFVFRLAGRERQQSASYYTPEVLTSFTVGEALAELLDQDGTTTTAAEILDLTVCEPALGSGAFAIEAVRQLAAQYLDRRQKELGQRIDPDAYTGELQKVKAYLALHNVYGVDLNATAVELAEISLWLDTMVAGLDAPWFGLHLRRGNSLIGGRRATYSRNQVVDKSWLDAVPVDRPLSGLAEDLASGGVGSGLDRGIHHFLLPAAGWGATTEAKEAISLEPEAGKALKAWRRSVTSKPTRKQIDALSELGHRVEALWQFVLRRLEIAEAQVRRPIKVWGADDLPSGGAVQREQIEAALAHPDGAYQRLRRVIDAWCALWFWPLTEAATTVDTPTGPTRCTPPTLDEWISGLQMLLGREPQASGRRGVDTGQLGLSSLTTWDELGVAEHNDLTFASALTTDVTTNRHPWLKVCELVAHRQGFFHWDLDYSAVFARGGFDLQMGNPPWVRPDWDEAAALAEFNPLWGLNGKVGTAAASRLKSQTLTVPGASDLYVDIATTAVATRAAVSALPEYPLLVGLRPDLYRCFMQQTWRRMSSRGAVGLIHPETHFTDEKAGLLREATYCRLRRHWQFVNELKLFEIDNHVSYGVHVYAAKAGDPKFQMATSLYHPDTVLRSLKHDGSGAEPGLKDAEGRWDLRPHRDRIITVSDSTLSTWHELLESRDVPTRQSRMVYTVNRAAAAVLNRLADAPRFGELDLHFSQGWNETTDFEKGYFEVHWGAPRSWDDVVLQGPHVFVATPMYKSPNKTMSSNKDWSATDFETLEPDALPVTAYKPAGDRASYDAAYAHWTLEDGTVTSARKHHRLAWRNMAPNTGERTLAAALIPQGAAHVHGVMSAGGIAPATLATVAGFASSLLADFSVRSAPKSTISAATLNRLPIRISELGPSIALRALRLNAITDAYAELWSDCFHPSWLHDSWAVPLQEGEGRLRLSAIEARWTPATPLRAAADRRRAQVEIDALVALSLGVTADELCTVYRTQFAVLYGYDRNAYFYDPNGRLVPNSVLSVWRKKGDKITLGDRTAANQAGNVYTYELPFETRDREADMRAAYAEFKRRLAARS